MLKELDVIWNEFKMHCVGMLSAADNAAKTYLDTCLPVSLDDGVLVLDVPTPFAKEQIKSRFLTQMKTILAETGFGTDIEIKVSQETKDDVGAEDRAIAAAAPIRFGTSRNGLNPNYVFSTFVVGKSNRLPHAACLAVAESPGIAYNPLFIWGKVGLGKTHLMHAIGHHIENTQSNTKVLYVSSEKFTNDFITAIRNNTNDQFRARYRELDVLMIDDIQFIGDKEGTQEEFFHTFNSLHNSKKQVIISSDRPPKDIQGVEDRLVSRFEWGLVTDIQPPDLETRVAILQKKAEIKNYTIPADIILFIAQNVPSNIRELEGTLNRVVACSEFNEEPINMENVTVWLKDMIRENNSGPVSIGLIQQMVSETFGFSIDDLLSQNRTADLALARQIAMYLARNKTGESLQQISYSFNKKDHTTVIHACKKVEKLIKTDLRVRSFVDNIASKL
ncbi:MAG: chromosomal replication initiator protein DnaA [Synergistaceae bacterium]|nr:chromosomal replication initiator protein DnaA [Synergistaceae bacterium]